MATFPEPALRHQVVSEELDLIKLLNLHANFSPKKRRVPHYPRINWGRGRLLPYESVGAFAAKFCRLNGIKPREFRWFLDDLIGQSQWNSTGLSASEVKSLARLLDEKESVVDKLSPNKLQLPGCYGTFSFINNIDDSYNKVSYCPECLGIGYHASFHEYPWLKKCPIHQTNLIQKIVPYAGGNSKFDRYIHIIEELLDHGTSSWFSIKTNSDATTQLNGANFKKFVGWVRSVQRFNGVTSASNLVSLRGGDYSLVDIDILLGRIGWAVPLPKCVRGLFNVTTKPLEPVIVDYPTEIVNQLASLLSKLNYSNFSWFYKKTIALSNENTKYRELVLTAVKKIEIQGEEHPSDWGWSKEGGWGRVDPDGWPYWNLITPTGLAARELRREWTDFPLKDDSYRQLETWWFRYVFLASILHELGYVSPLHVSKGSHDQQIYIDHYFEPKVRLALDPELKRLIEDLLYEEALVHIDEIQSWLKAIANGEKPYKINRKFPSIGNLFLEPGRAYLFIWPTS